MILDKANKMSRVIQYNSEQLWIEYLCDYEFIFKNVSLLETGPSGMQNTLQIADPK